MKQRRIQIRQDFHQEIAKRLHFAPFISFCHSTGSCVQPARLLRPVQVWHNDLYYCCGNQGNLTTGRAVPVPVVGQTRGRLRWGGVTSFICVHCTSTSVPSSSSSGQFLNWEAVQRHIAASKPCFTTDQGFQEIQVEVRTSNVMACAGGAARPAQDIWHEQPGDVLQQCPRSCNFTM